MSKTLRQLIKELRKKKALTQTEVAQKLKMKRSSYAQKELESTWEEDELKRLAKILGVPFTMFTDPQLSEGGDVVIIRNPQEYALQQIIKLLSMNRIELTLLGRILADQTKKPLEEVLKEIESLVNSESAETLKLLR